MPPSILLPIWLFTCYHPPYHSLNHALFLGNPHLARLLSRLHSYASNMAIIAFNHSTHKYLRRTMHIVITHIHSTFKFTSNHKVWQSKFYFSYITILDHDIMNKLIQESDLLGSMGLMSYPQVTHSGFNLSSIHSNSIVELRWHKCLMLLHRD